MYYNPIKRSQILETKKSFWNVNNTLHSYLFLKAQKLYSSRHVLAHSGVNDIVEVQDKILNESRSKKIYSKIDLLKLSFIWGRITNSRLSVQSEYIR